MVHNSDELKQKWDHIFSPQWLKALAASSPHDLPVIQEMAMIGAGLAFLTKKGWPSSTQPLEKYLIKQKG